MTETFYPSEVVDIDSLTESPANYNRHSDKQLGHLSDSLRQFGQFKNIIVWHEFIVAGHGLVQAAKARGWQRIEVKRLPDDWSEARVNAVLVADNEIARQSDPDQAALAAILQEIGRVDAELVEAAGFGEKELNELMASITPKDAGADVSPQTDRAEELQAKWETADGQIWRIGEHFVICGDCREPDTWRRLLSAAGEDKVNGVFTSPPYAEQRKEQYGGIPADKYVDWWEAVQNNVGGNLAGDGSFFVNIKPHCEDGQRVLYVMDLVTAMVRRWGWRYAEEYYWKSQGVPGLFRGRFRNVIEPVYQFVLSGQWKWTPRPGGEEQGNRKGIGYSPTGSGIQSNFEYSGDALPTNCIECGSAAPETRDAFNAHSAMFPVALPDFFIRAYSDPGDVWCDPFLGSGTTVVAAHQNKRRGLGIEKLPKYVAVVLERLATVTGSTPSLVEAS